MTAPVSSLYKDLPGRLERTTMLVVGDLMLDRYYWGEVRRISPEAPVPVVKVNEKTFSLGGAGNVAANLAGLGCRVFLMGVVGADATAQKISAMLADAHITDHCLVDTRRPTITKTRIMAGKQQVVRLDEESGNDIDAAMAASILESIKPMLSSVGAVVLSDYGKGMFRRIDDVQRIIQACQKAGVPVFVDPKDSDWQRYAGATAVTPNTAELEQVHGARIGDEKSLVDVAGTLRRRLSLDWLLVTRGGRGMALFGDANGPVMIAARTREVFDVSGAGDTVIATLAACVGAGLDVAAAAGVANVAAGIVVAKVGTQPVRMDELVRELADTGQSRPSSTLWKVADPQEAAARLSRWRQADQRIVFTNGCFDLLHPGHVSLLHQARHLGDRLIVGLNTDASIRRLKGESRPILPGEDRAAILSALEDVDMVVFFDEDTPLTLIGQLKPDILVKGADYRIEDVVGRNVVEAYGGQVRLVDILPGHSTTAIARKLSSNGNQPDRGETHGH
ncbi:bifunctional D-glycero-beta-D-manno-heptose-7-phosphate kinase/D-glycero-beta-D-manno-heptose 1-phosphate adenylyltransferase HldE [Desulfosarcina ovata]|uniref:Bifunctional protein HldE n=1 Tax=Desulfosarcina ovata subsp. ovata TaxID=2752305 RepID=A0A5K8AL96_9BACT|nr:bifunctional D-glycero-beta-D-manno-heptose-7-phosphate kinase/D-glycero-beta-D-manno-heptose 1-phosphate adenylyltransferase HldE [Desulfosarcina ovata]BBO93495.1 bifunctional protein HldE [Desulfosarcina ovata subsp. ovata]